MAIRWVYRKPQWGELVDWDAWQMPRPVGEWWCNDNAGNLLNDASGNLNHGTLTNMDPATDWVPTQYGTALDFDSSNDHVLCGNPQITGNAFSCVVNCLRNSTTARMLWRHANAGAGKGLYLYIQSTAVEVMIGSPTPTYRSFAYTMPTATWVRLGVTWDGTTCRFYTNGIEPAAASTTAGTYTRAVDHVFAIGMWNSNLYWNGSVVECNYFPLALDQSQVQALQGRVPIWQPTYYSFASAAAATSIPLPILTSSRRRSA